MNASVQSPLTESARELHALGLALAAHREESKREEARLQGEIQRHRTTLETSAAGVDPQRVAAGKRVVDVRGLYKNGGNDRVSVVGDAIQQLATGEPIHAHYGDLWRVAFGTKNYDCWRGQRSDHEYGFGPRHGHVVFAVGLAREVRQRETRELTPAEVEAAIYYLTNIERIQEAEQAAKEEA